jgi:uncharacterized membrane protein
MMPTTAEHAHGDPFTDRWTDPSSYRRLEWYDRPDGTEAAPDDHASRLPRALGLLGIGVGLARAFAPRGVARQVAIGAVIGVTIFDLVAGRRAPRSSDDRTSRRAGGIRVRKAITVNRSADDVYGFWRNFENLPRFMAHLESVRVMDPRRSYWKAKGPLGATVEWAAEIVEDLPNQAIGWRSMDNADVPNSGRVRFTPAPGGRGTEVHVELDYDPPAGVVGATIARLFGAEPSQQVESDLHRFKQMLEVGEVVHSGAAS